MEQGEAQGTYREDQGDTASHSFGAIKLGGIAEPEALVASTILPAGDSGAVKQDLDTLSRGQHGTDARVVMCDVDLGLWGETGRGHQRLGLVGSVNHCQGSED